MESLETRKWLGYIHSLFVDKYGNLREDTNSNDALDLGADYIIQMDYDRDFGSIVNKFSDADGDGQKDSGTPVATVSLDSVNAVWKGGDILWQTDPVNRTIFTTLDGFNTLDFTTTNSGTLLPYLRAADAAESDNIINWTGGNDLTGITDTGHPTGYRERSVTINSVTNVWKLGDIVHSTPTVVGRPNENYDLLSQGYGELDLDGAFPDRGYGMDVLLAEGDQVWMRFNVGGTHRGAFCGIAPTGRRVGVHGVSIMNFRDGHWADSWIFADELGLLLQLGQPDWLMGVHRAP